VWERAIPVAQNPHQYLTDDDANHFEIMDCIDPLWITNRVGSRCVPAIRPSSLKQWHQVTDGEQDVTSNLSAKKTCNNHIL
jgi:hypothetical protein